MVRRRVPSSDVDDIVQSVLCDALGAGRCPDDPRDVPRWVMAIAKHKVADFHRRRRREEPVPVAVAKPLVPTIEERDLLRAVLEDAERQPSARETIRILIREHEGETLRDIAIGEALSPELVRKRVSRFRKYLRARFLTVPAIAIAIIAWSARPRLEDAVVRGEIRAATAPVERGTLPSALEPASAPPPAPRFRSIRALFRSATELTVVRIEPSSALPPSSRDLARESARDATIEISDGVFRAHPRAVPGLSLGVLEGRLELDDDGAAETTGSVVLEDGRRIAVRGKLAEGGAFALTFDDPSMPRLRGTRIEMAPRR